MLRKLFSMSTMEGDTWHRSHATVQADGDWKVRQGPGHLPAGLKLQEEAGAGVTTGTLLQLTACTMAAANLRVPTPHRQYLKW